MNKQVFLSSILCVLLGVPQVVAEQAVPQPVQAVQQAIAAGEHPFFQAGLYPDWSKLTPEQARIDSAAAMVLARYRLEQLSQLHPGDMTFENTFLAYSHSQDELDMVQNRLYHLKTVADNDGR